MQPSGITGVWHHRGCRGWLDYPRYKTIQAKKREWPTVASKDYSCQAAGRLAVNEDVAGGVSGVAAVKVQTVATPHRSDIRLAGSDGEKGRGDEGAQNHHLRRDVSVSKPVFSGIYTFAFKVPLNTSEIRTGVGGGVVVRSCSGAPTRKTVWRVS